MSAEPIEVPICTCTDDWHAYNRENHAPQCPVVEAFATLTASTKALVKQRAEHVCEMQRQHNEIATLTTELDAARERLNAWVKWGDRTASGHHDAPMASLDHEVQAVIVKKIDAARTTTNQEPT